MEITVDQAEQELARLENILGEHFNSCADHEATPERMFESPEQWLDQATQYPVREQVDEELLRRLEPLNLDIGIPLSERYLSELTGVGETSPKTKTDTETVRNSRKENISRKRKYRPSGLEPRRSRAAKRRKHELATVANMTDLPDSQPESYQRPLTGRTCTPAHTIISDSSDSQTTGSTKRSLDHDIVVQQSDLERQGDGQTISLADQLREQTMKLLESSSESSGSKDTLDTQTTGSTKQSFDQATQQSDLERQLNIRDKLRQLDTSMKGLTTLVDKYNGRKDLDDTKKADNLDHVAAYAGTGNTLVDNPDHAATCCRRLADVAPDTAAEDFPATLPLWYLLLPVMLLCLLCAIFVRRFKAANTRRNLLPPLNRAVDPEGFTRV